MVALIPNGERSARRSQPIAVSTTPAVKSPNLPAAKKYLTEVVGMIAARVDAMHPAELLLHYASHYYHEMRDEVFKGACLPFSQARQIYLDSDKRHKLGPDTQAARLARMFLPAVLKVRLAQVRIERRLAALRTIEALRMQTSAFVVSPRENNRLDDSLREDLLDHTSRHVGQPKVAAAGSVGPTCEIQPEQMNDRRVQVVNRHHHVRGLGSLATEEEGPTPASTPPCQRGQVSFASPWNKLTDASLARFSLATASNTSVPAANSSASAISLWTGSCSRWSLRETT